MRSRTRPNVLAMSFLLFALSPIEAAFPGGLRTTVPGTFKTDWIGNTFGYGDMLDPKGAVSDPMNRAWVQNYIENIWVSENGTVYTMSDWDEGGRTGGIYRDGKVLGHLEEPAKAMFAKNGDIVGDNRYIYVTTNVDWGNWERHGYGIRRYLHNGDAAGWVGGRGHMDTYLVLRDSGSYPSLSRLAIDTNSKELYLFDSVGGGTVFVYDLATMAQTPKTSWNIQGLKAMVSDHAGNLWIVQGSSIQKFSNRGVSVGSPIAALAAPEKLTLDKRGRLHVFDDSTLQVHVFENIDTSPTKVSTFGVLGGIYSGIKGKVAPDKLLPKCAGLGHDAEGNLYMAWGGVPPVAGSDIRSYAPNGSMNWQLIGHTFVACGGFDPGSDGRNIYFRDHHYTMDYNKAPGKGWNYESFLWDRDNDVPSVFGGGVIVRRLGGQVILATTASDQMSGGFIFYRMNEQVATPAGRIGDGSWAWWIELNGDIWNADWYGRIKRYPFLGLDGAGNPRYDQADPDTFPRPLEVSDIQRIHYAGGEDALYVTGYDATNPKPNGEWGRAGTVFAKYDGWTAGERDLAWKIVLPEDNTPGSSIKDMYIDGDYAFFITCNSSPVHIVYVYSLKDGSLVGTMLPGPEIAGDIDFVGTYGSIGWIDMAFGIQAFRRSNGEYLVLFEDDHHAKNVLYRWCPSGSCPEPTVGAVPRAPTEDAHPKVRVNLGEGRLEFNGRFDLRGRSLPTPAY